MVYFIVAMLALGIPEQFRPERVSIYLGMPCMTSIRVCSKGMPYQCQFGHFINGPNVGMAGESCARE